MNASSGSKHRLHVLLLEGIHDAAARIIAERGDAEITRLPRSLDEDELIKRLCGVHLLGLRSRTRVTARVLAAADALVALGCFCVGTSQVDLEAARASGIPVFNAPFSSTRSVAELVMAEIVMLMRGVFPKSQATHRGAWLKSSAGSCEVRGKTLGIVGYGNIGAQLGLIAEAGFGMRIVYYDTAEKQPLGNAQPLPSLEQVLVLADVASLHVPETPETVGMIGAAEISRMRENSLLINASRGSVVDLLALADAIRQGRLQGAAIDVFPIEPAQVDERFFSPLQGLSNVILTPHIGGSTAESQARIADDVARRLIDYADHGGSRGAVNFPELQRPRRAGETRFLYAYRHMHDAPSRVAEILSCNGARITAEFHGVCSELGYGIVDAGNDVDPDAVMSALNRIPGLLRARVLAPRQGSVESPGRDARSGDGTSVADYRHVAAEAMMTGAP